MQGRRFFSGVLVLGLLLTLAAWPDLAPARADFDGDGYADLAVGVEWEDVSTVADAGAVNVLYGSANGITYQGNQIWDQDDLVATNGAEEYDEFGYRLAAGDFNGDGCADLAAGVPYEDIGTAVDGGAVHILYGASPNGLSAAGNQLWHQGSPGVEGAVESDDHFGAALAVGDFDGDGFDDLAVGVPGEDIEPENGAGAVNVLYGSGNGLSAAGDQIWYEGYNGLGGAPETGDGFGYALAAGDFDGDGRDDLAVAIAGEDLGGVSNAGRVVILYGTANGLSAAGSQAWVQGLFGVSDMYEANDFFGKALVAGDFNGDGYADLAIGVPDEDNGSIVDSGAVNVLYGSPAGLTATGNQFWTEGGGGEAGDGFGHALAAGDFNGDGRDDLAVGIPYEDLGTDWVNAGAVDILYGASAGLYRRVANDFWHQDRSGMEDGAEAGDLFGVALAAGDFNHDRRADLAVGIRNEDVGSIVDAGAVHILYGSSNGIVAAGNQFWHQDSANIAGVAETNDHFGNALAAIPPARHKVFLPLVVRND